MRDDLFSKYCSLLFGPFDVVSSQNQVSHSLLICQLAPEVTLSSPRVLSQAVLLLQSDITIRAQVEMRMAALTESQARSLEASYFRP